MSVIVFSLRRLHERGLIIKEDSRWRIGKPKCTAEAAKSTPVGLAETRAAFQLLFWGHLLSIILLVLELLYWKCQKLKF